MKMRPIQNYNLGKNDVTTCTWGQMTLLHTIKNYTHNNNIYSGYKYISILKNNAHSFPILQFFSGH